MTTNENGKKGYDSNLFGFVSNVAKRGLFRSVVVLQSSMIIALLSLVIWLVKTHAAEIKTINEDNNTFLKHLIEKQDRTRSRVDSIFHQEQ